jgi:hypothetical protein
VKPAYRLAPAELRRLGFAALCEKLGVAGAVRFIQQFEVPSGDYTRERAQILKGVGAREALRASLRASGPRRGR